MSNSANKVVLAYSGGLDTSVILKWLEDTYQCEIVTFTADIGQGEEVAPARAKAEAMGVNVFPGFAAAEVLYDADGRVTGVATSDMGIGKDGEKKDSYTPGYELLGKYTVFAEGVRGNLGDAGFDVGKLSDKDITELVAQAIKLAQGPQAFLENLPGYSDGTVIPVKMVKINNGCETD